MPRECFHRTIDSIIANPYQPSVSPEADSDFWRYKCVLPERRQCCGHRRSDLSETLVQVRFRCRPPKQKRSWQREQFLRTTKIVSLLRQRIPSNGNCLECHTHFWCEPVLDTSRP